METQIPNGWLQPVLRILRTGGFGKDILYPTRVYNDWDAHSLGAFIWDVREPIVSALSVPGVTGKLIEGQAERGVTYAFWFYYKTSDGTKKFYGKICLFENKVKIKLLSAHLPDHGGERL